MQHEHLTTSYDPLLVALSWVVAILAAFGALVIAERLRRETGQQRLVWQTGGALAFGAGVWAMHFIGMTALKMPVNVGYDPIITALSIVFAVGAGWVALGIISQARVGTQQILLGGTLMGAGIGGMHYTGMFAMQMDAKMSFDPIMFAVSVLVAVSICSLGLWVMTAKALRALRYRNLASAAIVGSAIPLMHYCGMFAARFGSESADALARMPFTSDNLLLLNVILIVTMLILSFPVFLNWLVD